MHILWQYFELNFNSKIVCLKLHARFLGIDSSVQFSCSVVSDSLWPRGLQQARPPCPSPTTGIHPNSSPSSRWCRPAIHPRSSRSTPTPNLSQHQSLFQGVNSLHEVAKVLELQLQHHFFQRNPRVDLLQNGLVGSPYCTWNVYCYFPSQMKTLRLSVLSRVTQ